MRTLHNASLFGDQRGLWRLTICMLWISGASINHSNVWMMFSACWQTDSPNDQSFSSRGNHDQPRIYQFSQIGAFRRRWSAVILMEDAIKLVLMEKHIPDNMVYICLVHLVCKNCRTKTRKPVGFNCGGLTSIANCFLDARVLVQAIQCGGYASREVVISY